jgi:glycosyltransferase involved in cell wall biosynthesis
VSEPEAVPVAGVDSLLVNLLWLRPGAVGGSEQYVVTLLEALADQGTLPTLVIAPAVRAAHRRLVERFPHQVVEVPASGLGRPRRVLAERRRFGPVRHGAVHHLGGTVAASSAVPVAVTIYDLQVLDHPEYFHPVKRRYLARALPRAVERADVVCVMSEFVADSLGRHLGVPRDRCRIVPPAVMAPDLASTVDSAPSSHRDGTPYLLYPAVTWPHKRHRFLVEVMERLGGTDVRLVLTGGEGPAHGELMGAVAGSPARDRIDHLGRVGPEELDGLYRGALALVFPSAYEGFGQPVVEAMARGCPVLAGRHAAVPGVVGDAGVLLPDDPDAWAAAIVELGGARREELVTRGRVRASAFGPSTAAAAQTDVYRELLTTRS